MGWLGVCIPVVILGVEAGWEPLPEGGVEYIIQLEPELLETLRRGQSIRSDIRPELRDIRSYRIVVGEGPVPRELPQSAGNPPGAGLPGGSAGPGTSGAAQPEPPDVSAQSGPFGPPFGSADMREAAATPPEAEPRRLPVEPQGRPIGERPAAFLQQTGAAESSKTTASSEQARAQPPATQAAPPTLTVILLSIGLFASLGGNVYLGWIGWEARRRWRKLLEAADRPEVAAGPLPERASQARSEEPAAASAEPPETASGPNEQPA